MTGDHPSEPGDRPKLRLVSDKFGATRPPRERVRLSNALRPDLPAIEVDALVDSALIHLCLPEQIAARLQLDTLEVRTVNLIDGSTHRVPYVGPVILACLNRQCCSGALVIGDEVILATIPLEDMDLVVDAKTRAVTCKNSNSVISTQLALDASASRRSVKTDE